MKGRVERQLVVVKRQCKISLCLTSSSPSSYFLSCDLHRGVICNMVISAAKYTQSGWLGLPQVLGLQPIRPVSLISPLKACKPLPTSALGPPHSLGQPSAP